jgi:hypothetical protein
MSSPFSVAPLPTSSGTKWREPSEQVEAVKPTTPDASISQVEIIQGPITSPGQISDAVAAWANNLLNGILDSPPE